jgi:hypothetical protein
MSGHKTRGAVSATAAARTGKGQGAENMSDESLAELTSMWETMTPEERNQVMLEKRAKEKYGEKGFRLAASLFLDDPELTEADFWARLEKALRKHNGPGNPPSGLSLNYFD